MTQDQERGETKDHKPPHRHWYPTLPRWTQLVSIGFAGALVLLAFAQLMVYLCQTDIMNTQAEISRQQLILSTTIERSLLIVDGIDLTQGRSEPDMTPQGLDFVISIRNAGRSTAPIDDVRVIPTFHLQRGTLPNMPNYFAPSIQTVITPIIPNDTAYAYVQMENIIRSPGLPAPDRNTLVQGMRSGDIPFDV
jgi:hypothetical protein